MLALVLAAALGLNGFAPAAAEDEAPAPLPPIFADPPRPRESPGEASQRRLLDERRQLDGRIDSLDRQLAPWESERLRSPGLAPPGGSRGPGDPDDPVMRRREMDRRHLDDQRRMIDDRLRWDRQR